MSTGEGVAVVVSIAVASIVGTLIGLINGRDIEQRAAAKAGVAEYRIDPETGTSVFTYLKEKP